MEPDFSFLFHRSSKDLSKGHPPIAKDSNQWPKEWKTVYYKGYPRLPKIALPETEKQADFFELIRKRTSRRRMDGKPTTLEGLSLLLKYSCGNIKLAQSGKIMHRAQPSGGERYPIEMYVIVFQGKDDIKPGIYHYNVKEHALDVLWEKEFAPEEAAKIFTYAWAQQASCAFIMTSVFHRSQMKYGERGYRYVLIEAGHIGQNLYLVSEALGMKCCALGGTWDESIDKLLDIDGIGESVVYTVTVSC